MLEKPDWLRVKAPLSPEFSELSSLFRKQNVSTVCQSAACPNRTECWHRKTAAFLILGTVCSRACTFCNVQKGRPQTVDPSEPERLAESILKMSLSHAVITSVTRDDLPDGGAGHFAACLREIKRRTPSVTTEVLTPDFKGKPGVFETVLKERPDVYNHNVETVPRLYPGIRAGADYQGSLKLLRDVKAAGKDVYTKSGLMLGLSETDGEVLSVFDDLRKAGVDFLTVGQYLRPSMAHVSVTEYVHPEKFSYYKEQAQSRGFTLVFAGPLVRSSHFADEGLSLLRKKKSPD